MTLILFVGHPNFRHPGLTTRRLRDADRHAVDACEYCERLTRDWEKRVCGILSGGADDGGFFSDYFSGIAATATRKPRYECVNGRFVRFCVESNSSAPRHRRDIVPTQVSFRRLDVTRVNRALAECEIPAWAWEVTINPR